LLLVLVIVELVVILNMRVLHPQLGVFQVLP